MNSLKLEKQDIQKIFPGDFIVRIVYDRHIVGQWVNMLRGVVNIYSYIEDPRLNIKKFDKMSDEWLNFIAECRAGKIHEYDIVEGLMADDTIWNFVNDYLANNISKAVFWEYAKFKHPTHQISFHSIRALGCLRYERSEIVNDEEME